MGTVIRESEHSRAEGFTLVEILIASVILCIALIASIQFLGLCILLHQRAQLFWKGTIEKWNLSREIRLNNQSPAPLNLPPEIQEKIEKEQDRIVIHSPGNDQVWEVLVNDGQK